MTTESFGNQGKAYTDANYILQARTTILYRTLFYSTVLSCAVLNPTNSTRLNYTRPCTFSTGPSLQNPGWQLGSNAVQMHLPALKIQLAVTMPQNHVHGQVASCLCLVRAAMADLVAQDFLHCKPEFQPTRLFKRPPTANLWPA